MGVGIGFLILLAWTTNGMACCVEYIILESDNLSSMFPNAYMTLLGYKLDSRHLFAIATTLAVLPTCWLRDLSLLSYISVKLIIYEMSSGGPTIS
ncbi:Amino acid transporter AVT1C [Bienertia sinuspersici]